jgi:hypothetical protein
MPIKRPSYHALSTITIVSDSLLVDGDVCEPFDVLLGPVSVFWVVGNASINNVLVTDYLSTNSYQGDRLRRVFPLSPFDYSIELVVNRTAGERTYSCVIDGATDVETTLFTYIVRTIGK